LGFGRKEGVCVGLEGLFGRVHRQGLGFGDRVMGVKFEGWGGCRGEGARPMAPHVSGQNGI